MPSARLRFAGETVILVLAALGLALAGFDAIVIVVVMALALVLVAMLELASSREAARLRAAREQPAEPPPHAEGIEGEPSAIEEIAAAEAEATPEPEAAPAVSGRSARALLASAPPPLPPEQSKPAQARPKMEPERKREKPARRPYAERRPKTPDAAPPPPPAEPEPATAGPPREWNLWELQRAVRDTAEGARQEEWGALLIHLREFANADGELPVEFDALVRESFADLAVPPEPAAVS